MKSWRQPSPDITQNVELPKENHRSAAKELKVAREEVAALKRGRTVLTSTVDHVQSDLDSSRDELAGLNGELAECQEQYAFQYVEGTGTNSERPERRALEPKLRPRAPARESTRRERLSPNLWSVQCDHGDKDVVDRSSRGTEASAIPAMFVDLVDRVRFCPTPPGASSGLPWCAPLGSLGPARCHATCSPWWP